jgi:hypothetical protein
MKTRQYYSRHLAAAAMAGSLIMIVSYCFWRRHQRLPHCASSGCKKQAVAAAISMQAAWRGYSLRLALGTHIRTGGHDTLSVRVCGANNCMQRGSDRTLAAIEDMVPPTTGSSGLTGCFGRCNMGPNMEVAQAGEKRRVCSGLDSHEATFAALRSAAVKLRIHPAVRRASQLREAAQSSFDDGRHAESASTSAEAIATLEGAVGGALVGGSVCALRLLHRLLLLRAKATRELSLGEEPAADQATRELSLGEEPAAAKATRELSLGEEPAAAGSPGDAACGHRLAWLESASAAVQVQQRLWRAHTSKCSAAAAVADGPRLAPAILLAAEAHLSLASCGGEEVEAAGTASAGGRGRQQSMQEAQRHMDVLAAPPFEPPLSRAHRVRAHEKRELVMAFERARKASAPADGGASEIEIARCPDRESSR